MYCKKCKGKMRLIKRTFHKRHKWVCPKCGRTRRSDLKQKE